MQQRRHADGHEDHGDEQVHPGGVPATDDELELVNLFETVRLPLAAVESVVVRQVLAVRVGDKRYVSPAVGRTFRQALKKPRSTRELAMTPVPGEGLVAEEGMSYADYVEDRLREMVAGARSRRRVKIGSPEQAALAADVVRRPALVQLGAVATVEPRIGATFFAAVVVLTIFAAQSFDPRLIWDAMEDKT